ncbi:leucine-rich repeat domain-containing protein [Flavobacterium panacis]|uniref:leucine-rich repeat domain-containing protein n=1 Tax=Flavobacterium panacis TaxID=2962567 RepID=UPI00214EC290|nr:leucine-rich repeat domain-containing protein [Flavobacterium panacis]MCR4032589.1 leucine-rich repeat domain-containing protein [Flavobacterium panacis]
MKTKLLFLLLLANFIVQAQNLPSYLSTNGLLFYYPFNGNTIDASGNNINPYPQNLTLTTDRFGNTNSACSFNGTSSSMSAYLANHPQNNNSRTITGWFKASTPVKSSEFDFCLINYGSEADSFTISLYLKGYLNVLFGGQLISSQKNYFNNKWTFFAMTFDDNTDIFSLYINGVLELTEKINSFPKGFSGICTIGKNNQNNYFEGDLDDLGLWNRVLSAEEISILYSSSKPIAYTSIPDVNFEKKLIALGLDSGPIDGKVLTENIASIGILDLSSSNITDLTGIEDFTSLTYLYFQSNNITSADLSKNAKLIVVNGQNNQLSSINLSGNSSLREIYVDRNKLTSLEVYTCTSLTHLSCTTNQITSINLAENKNLTNIYLDQNKLTNLNLYKNTLLKTLWCGENQLSSITLPPESNNLEVLYLNANNFTVLDISRYTSLKQFVCSTNKLTSINISKNTALTFLHCQENNLTTLDISKNKEINSLYCFDNQLKTLDVSQQKALTTLWCHSNQLTNLDLSQNPVLSTLTCDKNKLTTLNVKNGNNANLNIFNSGFKNNPDLTCIQVDDVNFANTNWATKKEAIASFDTNCTSGYTLIPDVNFEKALIEKGIDSGVPDGKVLTSKVSSVTDLFISSKSITNLSGIEDFTSLINLDCDNNQLTNINVSKNTSLNFLSVGNNQIKSLDVSKNIALVDLYFHENQITSIDVSKNTNLRMLYFTKNAITTLDVSKNTALTHLYCNSNLLKVLDISQNTVLTNLFCDHNLLTDLNVSKNIYLDGLFCNSNQIRNLDVSKNTFLVRLECDTNQLTSLNVSKNTLLGGLNCNSNAIINLDLSKNPALNYLRCASNKLETLNLKNGNNANFTRMDNNLKDNPNLTCIQVDNVSFSNTNWSIAKDNTASFSTSCGYPDITYTLIPDAKFEQKLIALGIDSGTSDGKVLTSKISNLSSLNVAESNISDLTGIEDFVALKTLDVSNNSLTKLDVSQNISLVELTCRINKLDSLNVSKNLLLKKLIADNNNMSKVTIYKNMALETAHLGFNKLTSLELGVQPSLTQLTLESNRIKVIDVSRNTSLVYFICNNNLLTNLDVSKNTSLKYFICDGNNLSSLNLKNGKNTLLDNIINLKNNPNLTCIQVDDVAYSNKNWANAIDATASFNTNCEIKYVSVPDSSFEQKLVDLGIDTDGVNGKITIGNISSITTLDLSNSNIKDLSGIEYFTSLKTLDISNNQLTKLDLSKNSELEILDASSNKLTTLDISKNTKLKVVYVVNNPLVLLNLKNGNNANFILPSNTGRKSASGLYTSFLGLTTLSCIQVDDENYSNTNWSSIKESTTIYANTCKSLSVDESTFNQAILYPIPTKGEINITNVFIEKATVYNSLGQLVKSFILNSANTDHTINLSGLPKGVYYVYLINGDAASAKKVIVE